MGFLCHFVHTSGYMCEFWHTLGPTLYNFIFRKFDGSIFAIAIFDGYTGFQNGDQLQSNL